MRRLPALALAFALPALALSGCAGFTPLYATSGVTAGLTTIEVTAPDGRTAFLLREKLDDALGRNKAAAPVYSLTYTLVEQRDPRGLGADNAASRYELSLKVHYALSELGAATPLKEGDVEAIITFGASTAPYAGIAAQNNTQERAAAEAAQRIRMDLAEFFAARARPPG